MGACRDRRRRGAAGGGRTQSVRQAPPGEPGLRLGVVTAEPDTANQQAVHFLASWADTTTTAVPDRIDALSSAERE